MLQEKEVAIKYKGLDNEAPKVGMDRIDEDTEDGISNHAAGGMQRAGSGELSLADKTKEEFQVLAAQNNLARFLQVYL